MWLSFLRHHNGVSLLRTWNAVSSKSLLLSTDASDWGFSAVLGQSSVQGVWPRAWQRMHINACEFLPIYLVIVLWGRLWSKHSITFLCNNMSVVQVIDHASTQDLRMLCILRVITFLTLHYDFCFRAKHIPSFHNSTADTLSCFQGTPSIC